MYFQSQRTKHCADSLLPFCHKLSQVLLFLSCRFSFNWANLSASSSSWCSSLYLVLATQDCEGFFRSLIFCHKWLFPFWKESYFHPYFHPHLHPSYQVVLQSYIFTIFVKQIDAWQHKGYTLILFVKRSGKSHSFLL